MRVGRLTLSDRAYEGTYPDLGGPEVDRVLRAHLGADLTIVARVLPDDLQHIEATLIDLCDHEGCSLVVTTGGTGPGRRDVTPEATRAVIDRELPGFGEVMRATSFPIVPTAILSRATAGLRGPCLIVNLPGKPRAISECLPPLVPAILECCKLARGEPVH